MYRLEFFVENGVGVVVATVAHLRTARALAIKLGEWIAVYEGKSNATGYRRCIGQFDKRGQWFDLR